MKKILLSLTILIIVLSLSISIVACNDEKDDNVEFGYIITFECQDELVYDILTVNLLDENGNAVAEDVYLDNNHRASISLPPAVYKVVVNNLPTTYNDIGEVLVSPTSPKITVSLTKKGSTSDVGKKVTYSVTVKSPSGELLPNINVQLCALASDGGMCFQSTTDENGVATFELEPKVYELHILENQWPDGYTFNNETHKVNADQREITVQFELLSE